MPLNCKNELLSETVKLPCRVLRINMIEKKISGVNEADGLVLIASGVIAEKKLVIWIVT